MKDRIASMTNDGEFEFVLVHVTCVSRLEKGIRTSFVVKDSDGREKALSYGGVDLSYSEGHRIVVCWKNGLIVWVRDLEARAPGGKLYRVDKVDPFYELLKRPPEVRLPVVHRDKKGGPFPFSRGDRLIK